MKETNRVERKRVYMREKAIVKTVFLRASIELAAAATTAATTTIAEVERARRRNLSPSLLLSGFPSFLLITQLSSPALGAYPPQCTLYIVKLALRGRLIMSSVRRFTFSFSMPSPNPNWQPLFTTPRGPRHLLPAK